MEFNEEEDLEEAENLMIREYELRTGILDDADMIQSDQGGAMKALECLDETR